MLKWLSFVLFCSLLSSRLEASKPITHLFMNFITLAMKLYLNKELHFVSRELAVSFTTKVQASQNMKNMYI
jgi:hypothetical protein